ncbi:InlB B-repeat-containing protein [Treponema pedis]|uniref:InlB B-repeat-containing protein n=1 Tax=Treponema pedis TaxID=409322 RepID=UPI000402609D|nr:hypothetical protein [Treponema pedis]
MKKQFRFFGALLLIIMLIGGCQPSIGTAWYNKSVQQDKPEILITSLIVKNTAAIPADFDGNAFGEFGNAKTYLVNLESGTYDIAAEDIKVDAVDAANKDKVLDVWVSVNGGGINNLSSGTSAHITVKIRDNQGNYEELEKIIKLTVEESDGEEADLIPGQDGQQIENPVDSYGHKKYIKTITSTSHQKEPFEYYTEDFDFPASFFDKWVLQMPSMSGQIANYKFRDGSWSSSGYEESCSNPNIGSGLATVSNVRVYRYKNRADRWTGADQQHFTPSPPLYNEQKEKRFYFYRFTGSVSIGNIDNSMFCVDKNSKFLFYYSDPGHLKLIVGNKVPEKWTDYNAPSSDAHHYFDKPFYMSDPVGFVKKDGSVVIYDWVKSAINNSDYRARQNFTEVAGKSSSKPGRSPYRDKVNYEEYHIETAPNPLYTASKPIILKQPQGISVQPNTSGAVFTIKVKDVPKDIGGDSSKDEELSYQWYTSNTALNTGGNAVSGETSSSYSPDVSAEKDIYVYCLVTNTNKANNKKETTASDAVRLRVTNGNLITDAAFPNILKQPKGKTLIMGDNAKIFLKIEADSPDNGSLSYQWYKSSSATAASGEAISGANTTEYKFSPDTSSSSLTYYYCVVKNTNNSVNGNKTAEKISDFAKIEVEQAYRVKFSVAGGAGSLAAIYNGKAIKSGDFVKSGKTVKFIATPEPTYKVKQWVGVSPNASLTDQTLAELKVNAAADVAVSFEQRMELKVTPKIYNDGLQSWSTAGIIDHSSPKYIGGVHLAHNCSMVLEAGGENLSEDWNYSFAYFKGSGGKGEYVDGKDFVELGKYKNDSTLPAPSLNKIFTAISYMKLTLKTYLVKSNRHDYWRTEYTYGIWPFVAPELFRKQCLDNNSLMQLKYDLSRNCWVVDNNAVKINMSEEVPQSPRPEGFTDIDPNFTTISYKGVEITYNKNFTLAAGEEKDFEITYKVQNPDTKSEGTVKVIYTLSWK